MNKPEITLANIESLLLAQKTTMNVDDLCRYTGFSKSFVYKLTSQRRIPFSCPNGKMLFFDRAMVDSFLMSNPISPIDDVEQEAINYVTNKAWRGYGI